MDSDPDTLPTGPTSEGRQAEVAMTPRFDEFRPGTVAGVVDDLDAARGAVLTVRASSHAEIFVVPSDEVLQQDAERRAHQGLLKKAYLALASSVSDQDRLQQVYLDEARAGHHLVVAKARDNIEADFDPQHDSTIRVQAGRLRLKLAEYYSTEGAQDTLVVEMPKGTYVVSFHNRAALPAKPHLATSRDVSQKNLTEAKAAHR